MLHMDLNTITLSNKLVTHRSLNFTLFLLCPEQTYLKEIMREIGTYNSKGAHKSTWELKPEYRHYQSAEEEEEMETA